MISQKLEISLGKNVGFYLFLLIFAFAVPNAFEKYAKKDLYISIEKTIVKPHVIDSIINSNMFKDIKIHQSTDNESEYIKALETLTFIIDNQSKQLDVIYARLNELEDKNNLME